jgi:error-prone DNA polymerase
MLDLGDAPQLVSTSGLPEMTGPERVRAELEVLGLDASGHVVDFYEPLLAELGVSRARDLLTGRNGREVWVAGVKVATQTPPVRSGRRVVFLTLDDATGPIDLTFFEDVQGPYSATVFHSWLMLCRGVVRRTGPRGVSIRATGAWELSALHEAWSTGGPAGLHAAFAEADRTAWERAAGTEEPGSGRRGRHVLVHASGYRQSPYADVRPAGTHASGVGRGAGAGGLVPKLDVVAGPPRKVWHASPGSAGH